MAPAALTAPNASSVADSPRGSSRSASGLPWLSARMRSRTPGSSAPGTDVSRSPPASRLLSPCTTKLREPGQDGLLVGLADGEHHGHGFDPQPAGDELQRLHRRPVQPLGVVHDAEQGLFLGDLAEQGQDGQPHQEAVGRGAGPQAEGRPEGVALRAREPVQPLQVRAAELVQAGVRELHLGLDAGRAADPAAGRAVDEELEQRGLADSGLAAQHQDPAAAGLHGGDEAGQRLALASSPQQTRP